MEETSTDPPTPLPTPPLPMSQPSPRPRRGRRSHVPRPDQCHNCGHRAGDHNFCAHCGQENRVPATALAEIVRDAWGEFVKIDSRLVQTVVSLLCFPGRLTSDYIAGKRARYIAPFRLYLTVSFLFFLLLSNRSMSGLMSSLGSGYMHRTVLDVLGSFNRKPSGGHRGGHAAGQTHSGAAGLNGGSPRIETAMAYESEQAALPAAKRDSGWKRYLIERMIEFQTRTIGDVVSDLLTTASRMMFVLLPVFALLLKLLYVRRRRAYVEHFVYALHIHTVFFLALMLYLLVPIRGEFAVLALGLIVYNVVAQRRVYGQPYPKTILKTFLLYAAYNIVFVIAALLVVAIALVL